MFTKFLFSLVFIFFTFFANAQTDVSGVLKDTTSKSNLQYAVITLLKASDSVLVSFTRADAEGKYLLSDV